MAPYQIAQASGPVPVPGKPVKPRSIPLSLQTGQPMQGAPGMPQMPIAAPGMGGGYGYQGQAPHRRVSSC
jgi:hypothetical protein